MRLANGVRSQPRPSVRQCSKLPSGWLQSKPPRAEPQSESVPQVRGLMAVDAAPQAAGSWIASPGIGGRVRPLALDLPLATAGEGNQRDVEGPRALVAVLRAARIVPAPISWIGAGFR